MPATACLWTRSPVTRNVQCTVRRDYVLSSVPCDNSSVKIVVERKSQSLQSANNQESREFETSFVVREFYCIFFINKSRAGPGRAEKLAASFSETFVNVRN